MEKPNLILLPGFQTNAIILKELLEYLENYYKVYFIDYPGFNVNIPAFDNISINQLVDYTENKIREYNLDSYILGGISFGFTVVNKLHLDEKCKGILAVEPFLDINSIGISKSRLKAFTAIGNFINKFELYNLAFKIAESKFVEKLLTGGTNHSVDKIINTTDPKTYFKVFQIIINTNNHGEFKRHLPHAVLMNKADKTLDYDYVKQKISINVEKTLILNMDMKHFPVDLSKEYFEEKLPPELFIKINKFFNLY